jgi:hypothetical protein
MHINTHKCTKIVGRNAHENVDKDDHTANSGVFDDALPSDMDSESVGLLRDDSSQPRAPLLPP